ncbi:hypothetical protein BD94_0082 [Elizabethkingia anophelis NUHP1]|uniref:Uncharacterized protein n=1 Tax=Elizabethkingia anophelis NUHP1 TaxID=1338011 RepID=A0A077E8B9_9FLAO|nr:hypothetical protein BD94_0082 [Elizabethkingia anophelis NUHP1]
MAVKSANISLGNILISSIISSQNNVSSASSTTIHILAYLSFFDHALHIAL